MSLANLIQNLSLFSLPYHLQHYERGLTPLSTWPVVILALATYLAAIFGGREIMHSRPAMKLTFLFRLHNIVLSVGSLILLLLIVEEILPIIYNLGPLESICAPEAWTTKLEIYYIINYYFKYVELLDTIFLVLKKKPLAFLHVYHHSATALIFFIEMNGHPSVLWVPTVLNLTVHVFMYYYYYATAGGQKIWWKKYLTTMQIVQFVIDLFVLCLATYTAFATTYHPSLPNVGRCSGSLSAGVSGCSLVASYLFLFISFYKTTYKLQGDKSKMLVGHANGTTVNGHKME